MYLPLLVTKDKDFTTQGHTTYPPLYPYVIKEWPLTLMIILWQTFCIIVSIKLYYISNLSEKMQTWKYLWCKMASEHGFILIGYDV